MKSHTGPFAAIIFACAAMLGALTPLSLLPAPAAAQAPPAKGETLRLVALGDSLTAGYGLPQEAALPAVLERTLKAKGYNVAIANAGVSGDTASGGLDRVDWSVPDGTDGVILALGANDMLRGLDPALTRRALEGIVDRLAARKIPVMLAGMYASRNLGSDYIARFDRIHGEIAQKHDLVLYPFLLDGVAGDRALNLPDGIHPTAKGIEAIVARMLPAVETFINRLPQR